MFGISAAPMSRYVQSGTGLETRLLGFGDYLEVTALTGIPDEVFGRCGELARES
jgi:hypothetical protein